jgi:hypothetical protein
MYFLMFASKTTEAIQLPWIAQPKFFAGVGLFRFPLARSVNHRTL